MFETLIVATLVLAAFIIGWQACYYRAAFCRCGRARTFEACACGQPRGRVR